MILIIENHEEERKYLKKELSYTFEVAEAQDGKNGFDRILQILPDLIITDIDIPQMDGMKLCQTVKNNPKTKHIPVILLSAKNSEETMIEGYKQGADDFVTKPFNTAILEARIRNLLESHSQLNKDFKLSPYSQIKKNIKNPADEAFINSIIQIVEKSLSKPDFKIDDIAEELKLNRRQLSNKIKDTTGYTVNEFIKTIRLNKAAELLITTDQTISEIAFRLGYSVPSNFTRSFTRQFGMSPSDFVESVKGKRN